MTIFHQETHFFSLKTDMFFGNDVFFYVTSHIGAKSPTVVSQSQGPWMLGPMIRLKYLGSTEIERPPRAPNFRKMVGKIPPNQPWINRVFHYKQTIHFGGFSPYFWKHLIWCSSNFEYRNVVLGGCCFL